MKRNEHESPINPYAPPMGQVGLRLPTLEYSFWRDGDLMVIREGADLPQYCLVTGEPANYSHLIRQYWQPRWVYFLLLFAVFPYAFVSPFVHRVVELNVPFGKSIYLLHQRFVRLGIAFLIVGAVLILIFLFCMFGVWRTGSVGLLLVFGVLSSVVGLIIASTSPLKLKIVKVERDLIYLERVHPEYLARLPQVADLMID